MPEVSFLPKELEVKAPDPYVLTQIGFQKQACKPNETSTVIWYMYVNTHHNAIALSLDFDLRCVK